MRTKLIDAKLRWAREGRLLVPDPGTRRRLPPGQQLTRDWPVLDLGSQPNLSTRDWRLTAGGLVDRPLDLDWTAFGIWLSMLLQAHGSSVLRVKGLLDVGGTGPLLLNGVQHVVHPPQHLAAWPDDDHRSRLVVIARGIEEHAVRASLVAFDGTARRT